MTGYTTKVQVELYLFECKEWLKINKNSSLPSGHVNLIHRITTNHYKNKQASNLRACRHEEFRVLALVTELARLKRTDCPSEQSDEPQNYNKDQASYDLEVYPYDSAAYLEV